VARLVSDPILVVYDITRDGRRDRIRHVLADAAVRIQQSAWLVPGLTRSTGPATTAQRLMAALIAQAGSGDRINAYAPCPTCARQARWLPPGQPFTLTRTSSWVAT
jgi:CRISPR/Cas system-associated endoribonuclease Cas2